MKQSKRYTVAFRRKRENKTNYKKRLGLLKSRKPRLVVRKSSANIFAQIINYQPEGDVVVTACHSRELEKYGLKQIRSNIPTAYLVGLLLGKKAVKAEIKEAVLDLGFTKSAKGSKMYAIVKGALEAGLVITVDKKMLPSDERTSGKHIEKFATISKEDSTKFKNQFTKSEVENLSKQIEDAKSKILKV